MLQSGSRKCYLKDMSQHLIYKKITIILPSSVCICETKNILYKVESLSVTSAKTTQHVEHVISTVVNI